MKVGILGSRGLKVNLEEFMPDVVSVVVTYESGEVSRAAEQWADRNALPKLVIRQSYEKIWGLSPIRLIEVLIESVDILLIFWNGKSEKIKHAIKYAGIAEKQMKVYLINK